jgi:hypothetical protein
LVAPKVGAKHELLFNELVTGGAESLHCLLAKGCCLLCYIYSAGFLNKCWPIALLVI